MEALSLDVSFIIKLTGGPGVSKEVTTKLRKSVS